MPAPAFVSANASTFEPRAPSVDVHDVKSKVEPSSVRSVPSTSVPCESRSRNSSDGEAAAAVWFLLFSMRSVCTLRLAMEKVLDRNALPIVTSLPFWVTYTPGTGGAPPSVPAVPPADEPPSLPIGSPPAPAPEEAPAAPPHPPLPAEGPAPTVCAASTPTPPPAPALPASLGAGLHAMSIEASAACTARFSILTKAGRT
jgi:hypothetical protein